MAEAFDLVLTEYRGYTDDSILDLTLDRFRQMVRVIIQRKRREMRMKQEWDLSVAEVLARSLGSITAGLSQSKRQYSGLRQALDSFSFVALLDGKEKAEEARMPATSSVVSALGVSPSGLAGAR
jgi:hypothetical protein